MKFITNEMKTAFLGLLLLLAAAAVFGSLPGVNLNSNQTASSTPNGNIILPLPIVPVPAPIQVGTNTPWVCADNYKACHQYACRFSGGVCDTTEERACQDAQTKCVSSLPPRCYSDYQKCVSANFGNTQPCPPSGCTNQQRDCRAEYSSCVANPPAESSVCSQPVKFVCFAGAMAEDQVMSTCNDNTLVYRRNSDGVLYHGTMNRCR